MTYDELEALVLTERDSRALVRALAPLDERTRGKLSTQAQKLHRQLYTGRASADASIHLAFALKRRFANRARATAITNAALALYALGPVSAVRKLRQGRKHDDLPLIDQILRDRRPAWIDRWIVDKLANDFTGLDFSLLRAWIRDGICAKPDVDGYYRLFAAHLAWGVHHKDTPIIARLLADPGLLADVEGLFRTRNTAFTGEARVKQSSSLGQQTWTEALLKLSADGHLRRADLLQFALNGLKQDLPPEQLAGMHRFYKRMAPDEAELRRHQAGYVDLLCHPVEHVAKFAVEMLAAVGKEGALDVEAVLRELPAVFLGGGKGNAVAALNLLKRIVDGQSEHATVALQVVGQALRHARPDVQSLAIDILDARRVWLSPYDLAALAALEPFVAASNRARFAAMLAAASADEADVLVPAWTRRSASSEAGSQPEYRPIASDRLETPILRVEDEIAPIESVGALIDALLHAVEVVDSADEVERIIDGVARFANDRPADFKARVAPLLHRVEVFGRPNGIASSPGGVCGTLRDLLLMWMSGKRRRRVGYIWRSYPPADGFLPVQQHLRALQGLMQLGSGRGLLSAPTHKGGWIDPLVWVQRLSHAPGAGALDTMDFRLSMLRLAPDHRAEALERARTLPPTFRPIAEFALGGDTGPKPSDRARVAAWITAARCRDPYRDWGNELAPLNVNDGLPDGIAAARYAWRSPHRSRHKDNPRKLHDLEITVTAGPHPEAAVERPTGLFGTIASALARGAAPDWRSLPTAALNRRLDRPLYWGGDMSIPWVQQWLSFVWPQNAAAVCMRGALGLMRRIDENSSNWNPQYGYIQPLFQHGRPWGEPGHLLLCIGLAGKDADVRGLAVDALIEGIEGRRFDPELFATVMARLTEGEWVKFNRVADALTPVIQMSALHARAVGEALEKWVSNLDLRQNNAFRILEVMVETQALTGRPLSQAARSALGRVTGSGKAAQLAKQLAQ